MTIKGYVKNLIKSKDKEAVLYFIGIIVAIVVIISIAIVNYAINATGYVVFKSCLFRQITGLYCPGCGGTRALILLLHGKILTSIIYHPFTIYILVIFLIFYISQSARFITKGSINGVQFHKWMIIVGGIILILNFMIKNIILIIFNYKIIP